MSSYVTNGECVTSQGPASTLSTGFTQILSTASGEVFLNAQGEQSFINSLGFTSCSGGGAKIVPLSLLQIQPTTMTTTRSFSSVSLAAASRTLPPVSHYRLRFSKQSTIHLAKFHELYFNVKNFCPNSYQLQCFIFLAILNEGPKNYSVQWL